MRCTIYNCLNEEQFIYGNIFDKITAPFRGSTDEFVVNTRPPYLICP